MSIIRCDEKCIHQQNGYCDVDAVTNAVGGPDAPCIYYKPINTQKQNAALESVSDM